MSAAPPTRRNTALVVAASGVIVLLLLVLGMVLFFGGDDSVETAPPPEEPEEEEEEEPPPPVRGDAALGEVIDLSPAGRRLFGRSMSQNEPVPADEQAVEAFVGAVVDWLDEHLTRLQAGEPGLAGEAGLDGPVAALRLTGPEQVVAEAHYTIDVGTLGEPEWARAWVDVEHEDGEELRAQLVFRPGGGGRARLVAAQGDGQAVASDETAEDETSDDTSDGQEGG